MQEGIYRLSQAGSIGGAASVKGFNNFLADYGDYGAVQRIATQQFNNSVVAAGWSSIPQTYQDLMLVISGTANNAMGLVLDAWNNDAVAYSASTTWVYGNGSAAASDRVSSNSSALLLTSGNHSIPAQNNTIIVHILNYTSSTSYKTVLFKQASDNNGSGSTVLGVGLIPLLAPITYFKSSTQNVSNWWTTGYQSLYGIKASAS